MLKQQTGLVLVRKFYFENVTTDTKLFDVKHIVYWMCFTYRPLLPLLLEPGLDKFQRLFIQSLARVVREGCPDGYPDNIVIMYTSQDSFVVSLPFAKIGKDVCLVQK